MKRYRLTDTGYKYDKIIFLLTFLIIIFGFLYIAYLNNFNFKANPYFNCKEKVCNNPFANPLLEDCTIKLTFLGLFPIYKTADCRLNCSWCNSPYLAKGEYGSKPKANSLYKNFGLLSFGLLAVSFLFNHLLHNKGKAFDIEMVITEKKKLSLHKLYEVMENEKNKDNS